MRQVIVIAALSLLAIRPSLADSPALNRSFHVLAYHDVRDSVSGDFDADQYAISTANLIDQFTWLRLNGFNVVSVDDILAASRGERPLPERAVLLTFDDGFESVATHVLPLLELFDYPAVVSIVTDWIESDPGVKQGGRTLTHEDFLSWDQVAQLANSGLVEIASHSNDMHRGITGNPQGNEQPAAVTAAYADGRYESPEDYAARVRRDLATSVELIKQATGKRPRIMTWPFGAFNGVTLEAARDLGMPMTLTLTDGTGSVDDLAVVPRHLIEANPGVEALAFALLHPPYRPLVRAAQVDLDYVYDPDPARQEENLSRLLDRIKALQITHVFLQAFADPDADGGADALYFPNRELPMRADLFDRVAWQLKTRADVQVFAWLPLLSYDGAGINPDWRVRQRIHGEIVADGESEPRLSPFSPEARAFIDGIYSDLARHAALDGILFHDDGRLNEFEDFSPAALAAYREQFGPDFSPAALERDPELTRRWAKFRSDTLVDFSRELADTVRRYRPEIKTARNLFATALLEPDPELRLAQNYDAFLEAYDYVAIMAMPRLEGFSDHERFYERLAALAEGAEDYRHKVIFELQTVDWRTDTPIDPVEIRDTLRHLQVLGIANLAYYPDDFIEGRPDLDTLRQGISVAEYPLGAAP
jgi:biofilm PGA synthesis lipoprotein PgaB